MTRNDGSMDDEQFDRVLREAARDYNAPPPAPVEAMWAAIEAKRATRAAPAGVAAAASTSTSAPPRRDGARRLDLWRAGALAAAAVLLLSVGIAIGHRWGVGAARVPGPVAAEVRTPGGATPGIRGGEQAPAVSAPAAEVATAPPGATPDDAARRRAQPAAPRKVASRDPAERTGARGAPVPAPAPEAGTYRAATALHLAQAEVLLTTFRAAPPLEGDAAAEAAWARDLLSTTRLLLDSPAARDPERRLLLEDLELVLVQLARLDAGNSEEERALIDRTMRRANVLTKLRAAGTLQGT